MQRVDQLLQLYQMRLEEKDVQIQQLRAIKHDIQAHCIVLKYYLDSEMHEKAKGYINEICNMAEIYNYEQKIDTGNTLVNALLEEYLQRNKEIEFLCRGRFTNQTHLSEYDMCIVCSNLISNAVEAVDKLCKLPKKIYLNLEEENGMFQITMENYVEWDIDIHMLGNGTSKQDKENHGYGIKNIKEIVEKYHGEIKFSVRKNKFCVEIDFPMISL